MRELPGRIRALPIAPEDGEVLLFAALVARAWGVRAAELPVVSPVVAGAMARGARVAAEIARALDEHAPSVAPGSDEALRLHQAFVTDRARRGVWYTPRAIVDHVVASVDELLPLGEEDVLDPAAGTGAFLCGVIRRVAATRGAAFVRMLVPRLHAVEIRPATAAICALEVMHALREVGLNRADIDVRVGNALDEAPAAAVVIGNPPWAALSANLEPRHRAMVARYRAVDGVAIRAKNALQLEKNLNDDYVKFIALAEARAAAGRRGAIGLVTNHSWLSGASYAGVRASLARTFDELHLVDLHGNRDKKERGPGGEPCENMFDGVASGTAIVCGARGHRARRGVFRGELRGTRGAKLTAIAASTIRGLTAPAEARGRARGAWRSLDELFPGSSAAVETGFDELLLAFTRDELIAKVRSFVAGDALRARAAASSGNARALALDPSLLDADRAERWAARIQFRPFDWRWVWWNPACLKTHARANMARLSPATPGIAATRTSADRFAAMAVAAPFAHKLLQGYDRACVFPGGDRREVARALALLTSSQYARRFDGRDGALLPSPSPLDQSLVELGEELIAIDTAAPPPPGARLVPAAAMSAEINADRIGSYVVAASWLKRRAQRLVDPQEFAWVVASLAARRRVIEKIDALIEEHGGWPDAFAPR